MTARSKVQVCGHLLVGHASSNPAGHGRLSVLSVVFCVLQVSAKGPMIRPEESYQLWCVYDRGTS
jgi:hypothetical protein